MTKVPGGEMKRFLFLLFTPCVSLASIPQSDNFAVLPLEVRKITSGQVAYQDFCQRHQNLCQKQIQVLPLEYQSHRDLVELVNLEVNNDISFVTDPINFDQEEYWTIPINGAGDCEDNAIEKKRRLIANGVPAESLYLATAFHREKLYAHALLLVVMNRGVFVLDQDSDQVKPWQQTDYVYEASERPDLKWTYYVQDW